MRIVVAAEGQRAVARVEGRCDVCGGTGWRPVETVRLGVVYRGVSPCECGELADRCELFNASGIPARFADVRLAGWQIPTWTVGREDGAAAIMRDAPEIMREWIEAVRAGQPGGRPDLLLHGDPGVGKTHLLVGAVRELTLRHGVPARYVDFSALVPATRRAVGGGRGSDELVEPLCDVQVLALDELGAGTGSDWERHVAHTIINARYSAGLATAWGTNYVVDGEGDGTLHARLGAHALSRVMGSARGFTLGMTGHDARMGGV